MWKQGVRREEREGMSRERGRGGWVEGFYLSAFRLACSLTSHICWMYYYLYSILILLYNQLTLLANPSNLIGIVGVILTAPVTISCPVPIIYFYCNSIFCQNHGQHAADLHNSL